MGYPRAETPSRNWNQLGFQRCPVEVLSLDGDGGLERVEPTSDTLVTSDSWVKSAFMKILLFVATTAWVGTHGHHFLIKNWCFHGSPGLIKASVALRQGSHDVLSSNAIVLKWHRVTRAQITGSREAEHYGREQGREILSFQKKGKDFCQGIFSCLQKKSRKLMPRFL